MKVVAETLPYKNCSGCREVRLIPRGPGKPTGFLAHQAAPCGRTGSCIRFCSRCFVSPHQHGLNIRSACKSPLQCRRHLCEPQHTGDGTMLSGTSGFLQGKLPFCRSSSPALTYALLITCLTAGRFMLLLTPAPSPGTLPDPPQTPGCCGGCCIPPRLPEQGPPR